MREDIRGHCNRNCVYNGNGRCDMFDDVSTPDINEERNNQIED